MTFALAAAYEEGLRAFVAGGGEESLHVAYELGRRALREGLGVVDLASAHAHALTHLADASAADTATFFAEAATAFEMALRGFREANEQLRELNMDLTMRNAELLRAREAAEAAVRELDHFTASVSHDLQAPVRRMRSFAAILEEDHGPRLAEDAREVIARIRSSGERMNQLIDDLLRLSKVAARDLVLERCDVSSLATEILARLVEAEPSRIVETIVAPGIVALADRRLLQIVLENLLGNAWKFTGRTANARIEVGVETEQIVIADNGAGFDAALAHRLFVPFQRLHAEGTFAGTGIGLATVERIVRRHGGRVSGRGERGRGAVFTIVLASEPASGRE